MTFSFTEASGLFSSLWYLFLVFVGSVHPFPSLNSLGIVTFYIALLALRKMAYVFEKWLYFIWFHILGKSSHFMLFSLRSMPLSQYRGSADHPASFLKGMEFQAPFFFDRIKLGLSWSSHFRDLIIVWKDIIVFSTPVILSSLCIFTEIQIIPVKYTLFSVSGDSLTSV